QPIQFFARGLTPPLIGKSLPKPANLPVADMDRCRANRFRLAAIDQGVATEQHRPGEREVKQRLLEHIHPAETFRSCAPPIHTATDCKSQSWRMRRWPRRASRRVRPAIKSDAYRESMCRVHYRTMSIGPRSNVGARPFGMSTSLIALTRRTVLLVDHPTDWPPRSAAPA